MFIDRQNFLDWHTLNLTSKAVLNCPLRRTILQSRISAIFLQLEFRSVKCGGIMAKKPKVSRQERASQEEREQREMLGFLREEIQDLHNISVIEMGNTGVLPPFYAARHLMEDREVLPMLA